MDKRRPLTDDECDLIVRVCVGEPDGLEPDPEDLPVAESGRA